MSAKAETLASGSLDVSFDDMKVIFGDAWDYHRTLAEQTLFPGATQDQIEQIRTYARSVGIWMM